MQENIAAPTPALQAAAAVAGGMYVASSAPQAAIIPGDGTSPHMPDPPPHAAAVGGHAPTPALQAATTPALQATATAAGGMYVASSAPQAAPIAAHGTSRHMPNPAAHATTTAGHAPTPALHAIVGAPPIAKRYKTARAHKV